MGGLRVFAGFMRREPRLRRRCGGQRAQDEERRDSDSEPDLGHRGFGIRALSDAPVGQGRGGNRRPWHVTAQTACRGDVAKRPETPGAAARRGARVNDGTETRSRNPTLTKMDFRAARLRLMTIIRCPNTTWVGICGGACGSRRHSEAGALSGLQYPRLRDHNRGPKAADARGPNEPILRFWTSFGFMSDGNVTSSQIAANLLPSREKMGILPRPA